jgi:hypothetical protein
MSISISLAGKYKTMAFINVYSKVEDMKQDVF